MEFRYVTEPLLAAKADLAVFCVAKGLARDPFFKAADSALNGLLKQLAREQRFEGTQGQRLSVRTAEVLDIKHVALFGVGEPASFQIADLRHCAARAAALAQQLGAKSVIYGAPQTKEPAAEALVQLSVEGALLGGYKFEKYRTGDKKPTSLKRFSVATNHKGKKPTPAQSRASRMAILRAQAVAESVCQARDFVNEPAGHLTPTELANVMRTMARRCGLKIKVLGRRECERLGMGMFLAVAQGSNEEPKFIHITYTPKGKAKSKIALIGKGVMFDSGGYSLKPSSAMEDMKIDMAGAAAVLSSMSAIAKLGCPHEVHAIAACCENLVSGNAYKLGDVLKSMDGATVEINNTDAEGRLTLGDAITYARSKIEPDEILDFATLTGACMVALGPHTAGVMSPAEDLAERWLAAAKRCGEDMWRLPLNPLLKEQLKSNIADMRNTGERYGGAITAGLFLQHFAKDSKWLHVDLAGPAATSRARGAITRGGTGFGVATIVEYLTR